MVNLVILLLHATIETIFSITSGRLRVKEEYLLPSITLETTLEYLIPTTTEAGACTTSLVDFLVLAHNDFIEKCRDTVCKDKRR